MARNMLATLVCILAMTSLVMSRPETVDEKGIVEQLKKLQTSSDEAREKAEDPKALMKVIETNAQLADSLLKTAEARFPKSPRRVDILSRGLRLLDESPGAVQIERVVELAQKLKAVAEAGSNPAAQADLVLLNNEIGKALKEAQTADQFRTEWAKSGPRLHAMVAAYVTNYPTYKEGLDNLGELASIAATAGGDKTRLLILESVAKNFPDHGMAKEYAREKAIGTEIELTFTPVGGTKETSLKDLKGKVVLIDIWATWCGPCKKEMPNLKKLYETHAKEGFEIIGVSLDDEEKNVVGYIKENTIAWPQVCGKASVDFADKWGIDAIPTMFVIDRNGKLRSVSATGKLEEMIPKLLAEK